MPQPPFKLTVDDSGFNQKIKDLAALTGRSMRDAFAWQGQLLCAELIKRTPPFSGKSIRRMLDARPPNASGTKPSLSDPEIENLSARKVGERALERDVRRVLYGVKDVAGYQLSYGKRKQQQMEWGTLQKVQGKDAVRVYARAGNAYGVDLSKFEPEPPISRMWSIHQKARNKQGKVGIKGMLFKAVGRWRWIDAIVTPEESVQAYLVEAKKHIGEAKGGWATGLLGLGGKVSKKGWIGSHSEKAGKCTHNLNSVEAEKGDIKIFIQNRSHWANGGDQDRIVAKSIQGRAAAMTKYMARYVEAVWRGKTRP